MSRLIIGLGTGRCGTVSLAKLLNAQGKTNIAHELPPFLSWTPSRGEAYVKERFCGIFSKYFEVSGEVSFFLLPYVGMILRHYPTTRFICLKRSRTETIRSYCDKLLFTHGPQVNHWSSAPPLNEWDHCYPTYEGIKSVAEGVDRYWWEYYNKAHGLEKIMPKQFKVFPTEALNDPEEILQFAGFENPVIKVFQENQSCPRM